MVTNTNILTASQNGQLFAIQQTSRALSVSQTRVATGNRVNSPIDNPQNYFASLSLSSRASDLNRVLDNITKAITTLNSADNARNALENIVKQGQSVTLEAQSSIRSNQQDIGSLILGNNPVVYYRLDEQSGNIALNLGSGGAPLNGLYQGGIAKDTGALSFGLNNNSVEFNGTNGRIRINTSLLIDSDPAGYPQRTVELTFSANDLNGRQVLFDEGSTTNSFSIYLDNDRLYFAANDAGDFGPFNISAEVEVNKTYQAAFVFDSTTNSFTGYLNGQVVGSGTVTQPFSQHTSITSLGRNTGGTVFHDGPNAGNGEYFSGKLSDFALYNTALTQSDLKARYDATQLAQAEFYQSEVANILSQVNSLVDDASIGGINLLQNNSLRTNFNPDGSSSLLTEGKDLTYSGLRFNSPDFSSFSSIDKTVFEFDDATKAIRDFGTSLSNDLGIINIKRDYISESINNFNAGSDDLTRADLSEETANILTLQALQEIQIETLSLSAKGSKIGDLLAQKSFFNP